MELVEHTKMALMHSDSLGQHFSKHTSPSLKQYLSLVGLVRSCSRMCRQQFSRQYARTTNCRCNDGQEGDDCSRFPFSAVDPYHAASPPVAPGGRACSHSLTMPMFRMQELHAKQDPACSSRRPSSGMLPLWEELPSRHVSTLLTVPVAPDSYASCTGCRA